MIETKRQNILAKEQDKMTSSQTTNTRVKGAKNTLDF